MSGASSLKITGCLGSEGATANVGFHQAHAHSHTHIHTHSHQHTRDTHMRVTLNVMGKHTNFNQGAEVLSSFIILTVSWGW